METEKQVAVEVNVNVPLGVPLGLQQLVPLSYVKIKQQFAVGAKYVITTEDEERLFTARQDVSIMGMMVGDFEMDFYDQAEYSVASLRRPFGFGSPKMEVSMCGELTSIIRKEPTFFKMVLSINDANDQPVLMIKSRGFNWGCSTDIPFMVLALDKSCIGQITKRTAFARPGSLHVEFPANLDTKFKFSIIGAAIFLDYILHVSQNRN